MNNQNCKYSEWDEETFSIPKEYMLCGESELADAMKVFFSAGGYDFFLVKNPAHYASNWLDFIGSLYVSIMEGKYGNNGGHYSNPLSDDKKQVLFKQGVPELFINDI